MNIEHSIVDNLSLSSVLAYLHIQDARIDITASAVMTFCYNTVTRVLTNSKSFWWFTLSNAFLK